jgi:uncharacterized membrane protein
LKTEANQSGGDFAAYARLLSRKIDSELSRRYSKVKLSTWLVFLGIAAYSITLSYYSLVKFRTFNDLGFDLGVYNQALWTALHGRLFYETPDLYWNTGGSFFGVHFAPLMYLVLIVYSILPRPETLLVLQSVVLGLGALPVYLLARVKLSSASMALLCPFVYLINPGIAAVNLYDFHLEAFLPLFFLFAFYFFYVGNWIGCTIFVILCSITIDYANLLIVFFGLYWLLVSSKRVTNALDRFSKRFWKSAPQMGEIQRPNTRGSKPVLISLGIAIYGVLMFVVALKFVSLFGPPPLVSSQNWISLGSGAGQIFANLLNPVKLGEALAYSYLAKLAYLGELFVVFAFVPLFEPITLIMAAPWFAISLLSNHAAFYELGWQYPAAVIPFLMVGFVLAISKILSVPMKTRARSGVAIALVVIVASSIFLTPLNPHTIGVFPGSSYTGNGNGERAYVLRELLSMVPKNASILTDNSIFAYVSSRPNAYLTYVPSLPQYILYDGTSTELLNLYNNETSAQIITSVIERGDYGVVASIDGIALLEVNYTGAPEIFEPFFEVGNYQNIKLVSGVSLFDEQSDSGTVLYSPPSEYGNKLFWNMTNQVLPGGTYEASFRMRLSNPYSGFIMNLEVANISGSPIFQSRQVYGWDLSPYNEWSTITLNFSLPGPSENIAFLGTNVSSGAGVYLDDIYLVQISPQA